MSTIRQFHINRGAFQFQLLLQLIGFPCCSDHIPRARRHEHLLSEEVDIPDLPAFVCPMHQHCSGNRNVVVEQHMGCHVCTVRVADVGGLREVQAILCSKVPQQFSDLFPFGPETFLIMPLAVPLEEAYLAAVFDIPTQCEDVRRAVDHCSHFQQVRFPAPAAMEKYQSILFVVLRFYK